MKLIRLLLQGAGMVLFLLMLSATRLFSQDPSYLCELRNDSICDPKVFEFDVYLLNTNPAIEFQLASIQFGINIDAGARNGGTITVSGVPSSSQLNPSQQPTPAKFSFNATKNCIIMTAMANPGVGNGTIISTTSPGTRVVRVRLTNTVDFGQVKPNLTWCFSVATCGYPTKVNAYVAGLAKEITVQASHTTNNLINPFLNLPPAPFNVTGTGNYCQGGGGLPVGLDGSELGVIYQLYKDGNPITPTPVFKDGTGAALDFGPYLSGTYTIEARRKGTCFTSYMNGNAKITEDLPLVVSVSIAASGNPVCAGTPVTFTATPVNGGTPTYAWYVGGMLIPGEILSTYTYTPSDGQGVHCVMTSSLTGCVTGSPATSNTIIMTVDPNIVAGVSIVASANPICAGDVVTFTATPVNGGTPTYQWYVNGGMAGADLPTYTYAPADGDQVYVVMTSSLTSCLTGNPATSNTIAMTVNPVYNVSVSIAASANPVCAGDAVTFTATPVNGGTPTYQWYVNGSMVGADLPTYTYNPADGDQIYVVMTSSLTGCVFGNPATSNTVTMTVNPVFNVSVSITASANPICAGDAVTFTAVPVNGGTPAYQWYVNGGMVGADLPTYTYNPADGDQVHVVMTSSLTGCLIGNPATSNTITMTVNPVLPVSVSIAADANPVCAGTSVTFTATPVNGGTPSYQWYLNGGMVGADLPTYSYAPADGDQVYVVMTSSLTTCVTGNPATSNTVTMTVNPVYNVSVSIVASANPVCTGDAVTFTATPVNGGTPSYQWYVNGGMVGANLPTYTYNPANGDQIYVVMTSSLTGCLIGNPATSNTVTMTVNPIIAVSVSIAASENPVCPATPVTFTATPINGGTPTFEWYVNSTLQVGQTLSTFSYIPSDGDQVYAIMTSSLTTCVTGNPATSNTITMSVTTLPASVTIVADNNPVCTGASVTFTATPVNGGIPTYQWYKNGGIVGLNQATYTDNTLVNGDQIYVIMTSSLPCVTGSPATSNTITMTVNPLIPVSVTIIEDQNNVTSGTLVTFTATPTNGGIAPTYKWFVNTIQQAGQTTATFVYAPANGDVVYCELYSSETCPNPLPAVSNSVTMTVIATLIPSLTGGTDVCEGENVMYTTDPGMTGYVWSLPLGGGVINPGPNPNEIWVTWTTSGARSVNVSYDGAIPGGTTLNVTVNPLLPVSVSIVADANPVCAGTTVTFTATPTNGGTPGYQWYVNGGMVGTGLATYSYVPANNDNIYVVMTSSEPCASGSPATSNTITMTVNPIPNVNPVAPVIYCNGETTLPIAFSGSVPGTTYNWVNDNPSIGLAANGTGDIPSFVATNPGITQLTANITVTPTANGCTGAPIFFNILVNPTPTVDPVGTVAYCNGALTIPISFSGSVAGTTYSWINDTPSIGLGPNGIGTIPSFTATNAGTTPVVATITVTPSAFGCNGTPTTFTITVNPTPTVNAVANAIYCAGVTTTAIPLTGAVAGSTFVWTNDRPSIGLTATGLGDIPSFTATNLGVNPVVATITVTPYANGCAGMPIAFTITVNPTPAVSPVGNAVYCDGATTTAINFGGPVAGTSFAWTNDQPSIGLAASGTGDILSFTATNVGTSAVVATITVTPSANGCTGAPFSFTITVNPTPSVDPVSNYTYCNGAGTTAVIFSSPVAGTTYSWFNNTPSIGLPMTGTGDIPSFTATNSGNAPVTATITVTPSAGGCTGNPISFTITVNPTPTVNPVANVAYCNNATTAPITLSGPVAGTTFAWTNNTPSIGLAASGTGNIPSFTATNTTNAPVVATITVTPSANGCTGTPITFTITINPTTTVNPVSNVAYCNGATTAAINFTSPVAGTTFAWTNSAPSIGLAASGTGNIPSFIAINSGTAPVIATITVTPSANGCTGTVLTFTITVNPTPTVNAVANVVYCNGATTAPITFSGNVAGTTYSWTNNTPSIGLAASGTGNIPSFTATNTGITAVVATITVTPSANGCTGTPTTFTITVNPTPTANAVANAAYCHGATTTPITLTGPVAGTTFAWTNSAPSIGLAASGTGNIPSFTATNTGTSPVVATITVTPTANGCTGPIMTFTITVNPIPTVNAVTNATYCNGATTAPIVFSSPVAGTTFAWINSTPSIGLAASGTGNIPSFTATNATTAPVVATITVTPSFAGCTGTPITFTITVNPTPTVNAVSNVAYCNGATTLAIPLTGPVAGTTFAWTNSNPSIGLAPSGTGDIPSFTATNTGTTPVVATITVTPSANGCNGTPLIFTITVNPMMQPTIAGYTNMCVNIGPLNYTTETGMTGYLWTVSSGGSIQGGQGTYQVQISWTGSGAQWVAVTYNNSYGCAPVTPTQLDVYVEPLPGPAGTITGTAAVCAGATGVTYSVGAIANATSYVWNLPAGATIASGDGTNVITVDFAADASSGDITVYGNNVCGNGTASPAFAVTVSPLPETPGTITGPATVCQGVSGVIYSIDALPNATGYVWTVPNGATIVGGSNTNSITVDYSVTAESGTVTVYGTNACGNGPTGPALNVTVNPIPPAPVVTVINDIILHSSAPEGNQWYYQGAMIPGATGQEYTADKSGEYWVTVTINGCTSDTSNHVWIVMPGVEPMPTAAQFNVYPVPNDGQFNVSITYPTTELFTIKVYNSLGVMVKEIRNVEVNGTVERFIDLRPTPSGLYNVVIENGSNRIIKKILINR